LNISQAFWEIGVSNLVISTDECKKLESLPRAVRLVYFWRTSLDIDDLKWWDEAKDCGVKIAYDSDDLTFEIANYNFDNVHALNLIPRNEANYLVEIITPLQERQVKNSDFGIAGTPELKRAFSRLSVESITLPIVIPRWMQNQGEGIYKLRDKPNEQQGLRVVYCSGSRSHGLDFQSCKDGVFNFLRNNKSASLTLQGAAPLAREDLPADIRDQVEFYPMVSHRELLPYLAKFHVQLAPLELGNNFVEAKSATKFMQGGIVGVPTIASPTKPFIEAIENGVNGYLASNAKEWELALEELNDRTHLLQVGNASFETVLSTHCLDSIKQCVFEIQKKISLSVDKVDLKTNLNTHQTLTWLLPNLIPGSGGHRNVFRLANLLQGDEFNCQVFFYGDGRSADELLQQISADYDQPKFSVIDDLTEMRKSDVLIGVHNSSIPFIKRTASAKSKIAYLVQDFEPWFNPMSDSYLDALSTYFEQDIAIFTSGAWMARKIKEVTGKSVPHFDFPVDKKIYFPESQIQREGILFFAKHDTPRRLFEVGKRLIGEVCSAVPGVKVELFGSGNAQDFGIPGKSIGLLPTLEDLAGKYRAARIGIAFSPTNPSLVPYEMMACGLPVIDIDLPGSPMFKYGKDPLLQPTPYSLEEMCAQAISLLGDNGKWQITSKAGVDFIKGMPTPEEAVEVVRDFFRRI
jgi:glycosyltransferase involved in cell wall biosynthesis